MHFLLINFLRGFMNTVFQKIFASFVVLAAILTTQSIIAEQLPKEIIAEGQWIIADMDGTLIGAPGYKTEPTLGESVAKEAIFNWLEAGGHLLLITGCETQRTFERFAHFIPQDLENALNERRLLISTNGGAVISYFDGTSWIEDPTYQETAMQNRIAFANEEVLAQNAVTVINDFYQELRENKFDVPAALKSKYESILAIANAHPNDFTFEELATLDSDIVPRIEIRRAATDEIVQIVIIGILADLNYDISKLGLDDNLEICKVSLTHEINMKGVDKALPIRWLQNGQHHYPELLAEKSLAVGDRPAHNDAPLTTAVGAFVSVCENNTPSYNPEHVKLKIGQNQAGSKLLLEGLLEKAKAFQESNKLEPVLVNALEDVVQQSKQ
jgi:hypothetical protein